MNRVNEVAAALEGTAKSLEDEATEEECEDKEFLTALDEQVFQCVLCGWWCPAEDQTETGGSEWCCIDCKEENEDED